MKIMIMAKTHKGIAVTCIVEGDMPSRGSGESGRVKPLGQNRLDKTVWTKPFGQNRLDKTVWTKSTGGNRLVESTVSRLLSREAAAKPALRAIVD